MFMDERKGKFFSEIRQRDVRAFAKFLTPSAFTEALKRTGLRLGKNPLNLINLVWLGVAMAWHASESIASVLIMTLRLLEDQEHFAQSTLGKARRTGQRQARRRSKRSKRSKHDPRGGDPISVSEEAFVQARQRMPLQFWVNLLAVLAGRFEADYGQLHRFGRFRVLAMDGTHLNLPNWKANRTFFGSAKNKSGTHNVQAQMVMLQFPFTRLPYRYELTPLAQGEITVGLRLVEHLQPCDLVLLDAGYWSYQLLTAIQRGGAFFAIRMSCKLNQRTVRRLRPDGRDRLICWTPKDSRGRWKKLGLPRSIELRVVTYCVPGFRRQAIATNVLDPKDISHADWTRLTMDCPETARKLLPGLFHQRWQIETSYHELKVDQGLDRHLRGRGPSTIQYEVAGHMMLYFLTRWLMVEAGERHGVKPLQLSFVEAQRELKAMLPSLVTATPHWAETVLLPRLLERIAQHRVISRPGRHFPRKKRKKAARRNQRSGEQSKAEA